MSPGRHANDTPPSLTRARKVAFGLLLSGLSVAAMASAWITAQAQVPNPAGSLLGASGARKPVVRTASTAREEAKPTWSELTAVQQQTLAPLADTWRSLSEAHKRKWIALSANYPRMNAQEQAKLRGRMTEWAALSPQARNQARWNFVETKKLSPADKKAAWEAYQALPPEEKKRLANDARAVKPPAPATAAAVRPVSPQKLARVPKPQLHDARAPRIAAAPEPLPMPAPMVPAPVPATTNNLVPPPAAADTKR